MRMILTVFGPIVHNGSIRGRSPWGERLYNIGQTAGGVLRYKESQHIVLEIFKDSELFL